MHIFDVVQVVLFLVLLVLLTPFVGSFMAKVFEGNSFKGKFLLSWLENGIYKICRINIHVPMNWKEYIIALLWFNFLGFLLLFLMQIFQHYFFFNSQLFPNINPALAFNTAVSFVTNTNWQSYAGETTIATGVQMLGLTVQNFLSAATGISVMLVLIRGIRNRTSQDIGNFWQDMTRTVVYILLPMSFIFAIILVSQGVIQTMMDNLNIITLSGGSQTIPTGMVASQEAIKQLGTNGGGYFGLNSTHPFENPTPLTNFLEMLAILLIPASLTFTFGKMIGNIKQGWILFSTMFILFIIGLIVILYGEYHTHSMYPTFSWMEGKEMRFGITNSALWANVTTCASNGSVNMMHDSLSPLGGMMTMLNMMFGEIVFGGVGSGMYGMLMFVILTVFIAGLMVGRTPELLGKKIEAFEIKMAILAILAPGIVILLFTAITVCLPLAFTNIGNTGIHGFSEILYAFTSAAANNGSAFAGLNTNNNYFNIMLGLGMVIGRFGVLIPVLAIAGNLSAKKQVCSSSGTLRSDTPLFIFLLMSIIIIVGALTFFPVLSLSTILEHLLMLNGQTF